MSPEEARREARLLFGNPAATRERVAAADASLGLDNCARDLRYAARQLRRSPGFAFTAILTLAVGIGANVVVFGVLNALLLKPLHVAGAERLFQIEQEHEGRPFAVVSRLSRLSRAQLRLSAIWPPTGSTSRA